jgi:transposase
LKADAEMSRDERTLRDRLEGNDRDLHQAADLGRQFRQMVRQRQAEAWDDWLCRAQEEVVPDEVQTFAKGLKDDE